VKSRRVLDEAEAALRKATYVYFLGFGFDERNLQRLNLPDSIKGAAVVRATTLGWSAAEALTIQRLLFGVEVRRSPVDVISFLREHGEAFFD